jgi:4-hydroxy-2-oxoheptanedioate aldolase
VPRTETGRGARSKVRSSLSQGRVIRAVTLNFLNAGLAEYVASLGFDCVVVDAEHGPVDQHLEDVVRAADLGRVTPLLRIPPGVARLQAYLDTGFGGVQIPQVRSIEDVQQVVDMVKFIPNGRRGAGAGRVSHFGALSQDAEFTQRMNDTTVVIVQIETREALNILSDIVKHADVDVILAGPLDLSHSLGVPGNVEHRSVIEAIAEIVERTLTEGKVVGLPYSTPEEAKAAVDRGARFILTSVVNLLGVGGQKLGASP